MRTNIKLLKKFEVIKLVSVPKLKTFKSRKLIIGTLYNHNGSVYRLTGFDERLTPNSNMYVTHEGNGEKMEVTCAIFFDLFKKQRVSKQSESRAPRISKPKVIHTNTVRCSPELEEF